MTVLHWFKELVGFLMISGLFLMLVPDADIRRFVRLITGLLLIALMLQPLTGSGTLMDPGSIAAGFQNRFHALRTGQGGMLETDGLQMQAERLVEKGTGIMREQMVNQANRQLSSLLSLFAGVKDAQAAVQLGAGGGLERVVVQLYVEGDVPSPYSGPAACQVEPVAPVLIMKEALQQDESPGFPLESLTGRVQSFVADFFGIEPEAVIVTIAG